MILLAKHQIKDIVWKAINDNINSDGTDIVQFTFPGIHNLVKDRGISKSEVREALRTLEIENSLVTRILYFKVYMPLNIASRISDDYKRHIVPSIAGQILLGFYLISIIINLIPGIQNIIGSFLEINKISGFFILSFFVAMISYPLGAFVFKTFKRFMNEVTKLSKYGYYIKIILYTYLILGVLIYLPYAFLSKTFEMGIVIAILIAGPGMIVVVDHIINRFKSKK